MKELNHAVMEKSEFQHLAKSKFKVIFWNILGQKLFGKDLGIYIFFGLKAKDFRQGYQNCVLRIQGNILGPKKKQDYIRSELANSGEKSLHSERMNFLS